MGWRKNMIVTKSIRDSTKHGENKEKRRKTRKKINLLMNEYPSTVPVKLLV